MIQNTRTATYSLTIEGLTINDLSFCPRATCDLLEQMNLIEGFAIDRNGEPIILYTKEREDGEGNWDIQTGFCEWYEFVKTFFFNEVVAEMVQEHIADGQNFQNTLSHIDNLINAAA